MGNATTGKERNMRKTRLHKNSCKTYWKTTEQRRDAWHDETLSVWGAGKTYLYYENTDAHHLARKAQVAKTSEGDPRGSTAQARRLCHSSRSARAARCEHTRRTPSMPRLRAHRHTGLAHSIVKEIKKKKKRTSASQKPL